MTGQSPQMIPPQLRIHREPCQTLDEQAVHHALTADPVAYMAHLKLALADIAQGRATIEHPPKMLFEDGPGEGDFRVMPCVVRRAQHVRKTVKIVGTNLLGHQVPDQVTVGKALVLDDRENFISHILDACLLSSARTGACAALFSSRAARTLSRVTIIGAGRVAYYTARYLLAEHPGLSIQLFDTVAQRAQSMANLLHEQTRADVRAVPGGGVHGHDLVILATTSRQPILSRTQTDAPFIISLGADTTEQRELADDWAEHPRICIDSADAWHVGDLAAWRASGRILPRALPTLLELYADASPAPLADSAVFISTGMALMDNLTIDYLLGR